MAKDQLKNITQEIDKIKIGDKEYNVCFTLKSFKHISKHIEGGISGLQIMFKDFSIASFNEQKIDCLVNLIYAGIISKNKNIDIDSIKDEIESNIGIKETLSILNVLMASITKSLPEGNSKNE